MKKPVIILGIETSCDETAAAIMIDGEIAADRTTTQVLHEQYGGVVPELASRAHEKLLSSGVKGALMDSGIQADDLSGVAVTHGPGLAGALLVGVAFAKGMTVALNKPLIGVNHLEGHLWSASLEYEETPLPFLSLIISGGHTLLVRVDGFGQYTRLGGTRDDAAGELFDKAGRMLGFGFPAGASIDRLTAEFEGQPVRFPRARLKNDPLSFSFSGLKTAVLYYLQKHFSDTSINENEQRLVQSEGFNIPEKELGQITAGLMFAVGDMLVSGIQNALKEFDYKALVISGGVSASQYLRKRFQKVADNSGIPLYIPKIDHCTDNGSMIANVGYKHFMNEDFSLYDLPINPSLSLFNTDNHIRK